VFAYLTQLTKIDEDFTSDMQEMDGETRIRLWADVAGVFLEVGVTGAFLRSNCKSFEMT